jgi:hypothetical protein
MYVMASDGVRVALLCCIDREGKEDRSIGKG